LFGCLSVVLFNLSLELVFLFLLAKAVIFQKNMRLRCLHGAKLSLIFFYHLELASLLAIFFKKAQIMTLMKLFQHPEVFILLS